MKPLKKFQRLYNVKVVDKKHNSLKDGFEKISIYTMETADGYLINIIQNSVNKIPIRWDQVEPDLDFFYYQIPWQEVLHRIKEVRENPLLNENEEIIIYCENIEEQFSDYNCNSLIEAHTEAFKEL